MLTDGINKSIYDCTISEIYTEINFSHPKTTEKERALYNLIKLWKDAHAGFDMKESLHYLNRYYEKLYQENKNVKSLTIRGE